MSDDISGYYFDPNHGNCLRRIYKKSSTWHIIGAYGNDEPPHRPGEVWKARLKKRGLHLDIDFKSKTVDHAKTYSALYCPTERIIRWQDGNTWVQLYAP